MTFDTASLNSEVMDTITDFSDEYDATESVDYATRCSKLKPGSTVPAKDGIKLTDNRQHIDSYAYAAAEKIREICGKQRSKVLDEMSVTPSEEALRMMQAVSLRGDSVSLTELQALESKYGSNYQVRKFIADQMTKRKLGSPGDDACDLALVDIAHAEKVGLENVSARSIESSQWGKKARLALIKQQLGREGMFGAFR